MVFDVAAFLLGMPDDLPFGSIESVSQCDIGILVRVAVDNDFVSRNVQIDAHIECIPLMLVMVGFFNGHVATGQIGMQLPQCLHSLADVVLKRGRARHSMK